MSAIEVGELLYTVTLNITGIKEYGVSFAALMAGEVTPPVEGARFDVPFEGTAAGPKLNGAAEDLIVRTGETRTYGNAILRKGVVA